MNAEQDRARVVYDCVVFLQGLIKEIGPGVGCLELFENGSIELFISETVLNEIGDVPDTSRTPREVSIIDTGKI